MFGNGRKTIGVILCDASSHYQEQICHAISTYAQIADYNIAYFTFYTCYGVDTRNGRGEANIVHLIPYDKLDAVIYCDDTIQNESARKRMWDFIDEKCSCPVVTLRRDSGKYPCVCVRQEHSIEQMVYHFVDTHHLRRLAYMSGPFDHPDAQKRLEDYKTALSNRGIEYDERLVFEGDFWKLKTKAAAEYFMMELEEPPEAIICANDYMATSLSNELISKGYLIPDDVAISGYDDIWEASVTMPPITTVAVPVEDMAKKAIGLIEKMWAGEEIERVNYLPVDIKYRNSCGCRTFNMQTMLSKWVRQEREHQRTLDYIQTNTYLFVDMSDTSNLDGIERKLRLLEDKDNHVRNFFVCLGEGKGDLYPKYRSARQGFASKSHVVGGWKDGSSVDLATFDTSDLLPPEAAENRPMIYYFFPLHNNQYSFGYFAISYDDTYGPVKTFHNWLAIIGNALETVWIKQKNMGLLQELNNLYIRDALTGLYNRRGFENKSREYYEKAKKEKTGMAVIAIDMDNLKIVNDRFGHMNGDLALKTIGAAMDAASREGDICARVGGDEYNVVGVHYTEEDAEEFIREFQDFLDDFNDKSDLPYLVYASVGYVLMKPGEKIALEECIQMADNRLYENKRKRKEGKGHSVLRQEE